MKTHFISIAAGVALTMAAGTASAATYISQMDFSNKPTGRQEDAATYGYQVNGVYTFGTVKIVEGGLNNLGAFVADQKTNGVYTSLDITVTLASGLQFVDTGNDGNHEPFVWNLVKADGTIDTSLSSASNATTKFALVKPNPNGDNWSLNAPTGYTNDPFNKFADGLSCCGNGGSSPGASPLEFTITRTAGISFLGAGGDGSATDDRLTSNNNLYNQGNGGVWWFSSDVIQKGAAPNGDASLNTFLIGATLATPVTSAPEPMAWALMLIGFGGLGAMLRRKRALAHA